MLVVPDNGRKIDNIDVISGIIREPICDIVSSYFCFSSYFSIALYMSKV